MRNTKLTRFSGASWSALVAVAALPTLAFAYSPPEPLVVDMRNGTEKVQIEVRNCKPGYQPVFNVGKVLYWKTDSKKSGVTGTDYYSTYYETVTAECAPKVCEYRYFWKVFGNPRATITLLPERKEIARLETDEETEAALRRFLATGVCAKALSHTQSKP